MKLPRLKEIRELRGWSQSELSKASGVSKARIVDYERHDIDALPTTARKLANGLGVDVIDLVMHRDEADIPLGEAPKEPVAK